MNQPAVSRQEIVAEPIDPGDDQRRAVERIAESVVLVPEAPLPPQRVVLPSGRTAIFDQASAERLTVYNADGGLELTIRFTDRGPVVHVAAAALHLATDGDIHVDCDKFRLQARTGVEIASGGDLRQLAEGRQIVQASGAVEVRAQSVDIASEGVLAIAAEKDVFINGEDVRINC